MERLVEDDKNVKMNQLFKLSFAALPEESWPHDTENRFLSSLEVKRPHVCYAVVASRSAIWSLSK